MIIRGMTKRSVGSVVLLSIVTFGIYALIWFVKTKDEMNKAGADIPSAWLMIVPFAGIYWMWKWAGGAEIVTRGKQSQGVAFIMVFLLSIIGIAIMQDAFNKASDELPMARVA